jgi:tetrahydromethanopterin:alpha-L-glutamate ligase
VTTLPLRVLLISDTRDWHARRMEEAYHTRGIETVRLDLADCEFSTLRASGLDLPGFDALPNVVHVRTMSGGSFEAITRRLGVLHALQQLGVRVLNNARAIEACVDKSMTSFLIARTGIASPDTWALESFERARALADRECMKGPLGLKPLFGAQGKGLRLVRGPDDLPPPNAISGVYYLQRFERVDGEGFRDFRLFVCGGRVVASMMRRAPTWITNVKQGGEPFAVARDAQLEALALAAARAVGADIAGVDLIVGADGPKVLEVNSMPAWRGLQKVTDANIANLLAEAVLRGLD